MGAMTPPSRKSCYNFRVTEINRVLDGDTIDVTIDLGFDLYKKERVRIAGVDTPEKRTRDLEEKALGIDATNWMKEKLEGAIAGDDELTIRTELVGGMGKYGRLLGWLYIGDAELSLNEQMITEGYAWEYDGGTKKKILKNSVKSETVWNPFLNPLQKSTISQCMFVSKRYACCITIFVTQSKHGLVLLGDQQRNRSI